MNWKNIIRKEKLTDDKFSEMLQQDRWNPYKPKPNLPYEDSLVLVDNVEKFAEGIKEIIYNSTKKPGTRIHNTWATNNYESEDWFDAKIGEKEGNYYQFMLEVISKPENFLEAAKIFGKLDIDNPQVLEKVLSELSRIGIQMDSFPDIKGLLPEKAESSTHSGEDYTNKIREIIRMYKSMNKPITQESIMEELDMKEWSDKYDNLLQGV